MIEKVWSYGFTTIGRSAGHAASGSTAAANGASSSNGSDVVEGLGSGGQQNGPRGGIGGLAGLMRSGGGSRFQMAGLGFGLPLSRVYARYFGGDLKLQSVPGYGVDAYLQLRRLEEHEWAWREHVDDSAPLPLKTPY
ncbi:hypothetical protein GPECTOR_7g1201 [Gonium pectorale]|uniref:Protein-serine/threonine kinase n=1 Tax=Gonium pectorale TaxID=33097 RepID=A0A150GTW8_GONPE|nr:hypothetical protein GPECTOR_7g1201 [Gonium pectorale]|eukprot:KXZ53307.1 hypothetical protein GPECTOR_7g1201 [Gonium pectorale]